MMRIKNMISVQTKRLIKCASGIAATEFALLLPVMTLLFFGMVEGSDAMTVSRRISNAANSMADLVGREPQVSYAEVDDVMVGVKRLLEPTDTSTLTMRLVSVEVDPDDGDQLIVHWSRDQNGDEPYAPGAVYTNISDIETLKSPMTMVVVEMNYEYVSNLTDVVFDNPIQFDYFAKRWPRKSTRVNLCEEKDNDGVYSNCTS